MTTLLTRNIGGCITPLTSAIFLHAFFAALILVGVLPIGATVALAAGAVTFVLVSDVRNGVYFTVFSIPLFTAVFIAESFDTLAVWRLVVAVLVAKAAFLERDRLGEYAIAFFKTRIGILLTMLFALAALSLLVADSPFAGAKKIIFWANALAFFFPVWLISDSKEAITRLVRYAAGAGIVVLAVGYAQLLSTFVITLSQLWEWWATHAIAPMYGGALANLMLVSNTWFSYYEDASATLRMFSLFPDSHSFALFVVLALPFTGAFLYVAYKGKNKNHWCAWGILNVLALAALIFSGTRGIWLSAGMTFIVVVGFYLARRLMKFTEAQRSVVKFSLGLLVAFALLFPVTAQVLNLEQYAQGSHDTSSSTTLRRFSSSFDFSELSNKGRIEIWQRSIESVYHRPLLGVGAGNFPSVLDLELTAGEKGASAHSLYLDVAVEMGIVAAIVVALIFFELFLAAYSGFRRAKDMFFVSFLGLSAVVIIMTAGYSLVDVVVLNGKVLLLFVTLTAIIYGARQLPENKKRQSI